MKHINHMYHKKHTLLMEYASQLQAAMTTFVINNVGVN